MRAVVTGIFPSSFRTTNSCYLAFSLRSQEIPQIEEHQSADNNYTPYSKQRQTNPFESFKPLL